MWYFVGKIRRIPIFGTLSLIIVLIFSEYNFKDLYELLSSSTGFKSIFATYLIYSLFLLPIVEIIFVLLRKLDAKFFKGKDYDFGDFFVTLFRDLTSPFLAIGIFIKAITDKSFISTTFGWVETIFGILWVTLWGIFICIGLVIMI